VKIAVLTLVATQLMNLVFIFPLKHAGLALAIGLGGCLNAALLFRGLRRADIYRPEPLWGMFVAKLGTALAMMTVVLWFASGAAEWWLDASGFARVARLTGVVSAGALTYFGTLWVLGFRVRDFARRAVS
jgi:putative peptidoglycan lipid II flippase